jgi:hypothetical protein
MEVVNRHIKAWKEIALDTHTDKDRAETAVVNLYEALGRKKPDHIFWVATPTEGVVASYILTRDDLEDQLEIRFKVLMDNIIGMAVFAKNPFEKDDPRLGQEPWKTRIETFTEGHDAVREDNVMQFLNQYNQKAVMDQLDSWFKDGKSDRKYIEMCETVFENVPDEFSDNPREEWAEPGAAGWVMARLIVAIHGSMDAMWLVAASVTAEIYGDDFPAEMQKKYRAISDTMKECGWFFPFENFVIMVPKPSYIGTNDNGFHADEKLAIQYAGDPDYGTACLNGVLVPRWLALTPANKLDPKIITSNEELRENAEVRREFVRKVGIERIFAACHAEVIDKSDDGMYELVLLDLGDGRRRPFLKMRNPSLPGIYHIEGVEPLCETVIAALTFRNGTDVPPAKLT